MFVGAYVYVYFFVTFANGSLRLGDVISRLHNSFIATQSYRVGNLNSVKF
jgi:hypothetical protein